MSDRPVVTGRQIANWVFESPVESGTNYGNVADLLLNLDAQLEQLPLLEKQCKIEDEQEPAKATLDSSDYVNCRNGNSKEINNFAEYEFYYFPAKSVLQAFDLLDMLHREGPIEYYDNRVSKLLSSQPSSVIGIYKSWLVGAFRSQIIKTIKLIGPFLCVEQDEFDALEKCRMKRSKLIIAEPWEPIPPIEILYKHQMAIYLEAFLLHFGPMWVFDVIFGYLCFSLPASVWPKDTKELVNVILRDVPEVIKISDTLYWSYSLDHQQRIREALSMKK